MKKYIGLVLVLFLALGCSSDDDSATPSTASSDPLANAVPCDATHTNRVGAVCNDGSRSQATGSGACSHHGGVDYWLCSK